MRNRHATPSCYPGDSRSNSTRIANKLVAVICCLILIIININRILLKKGYTSKDNTTIHAGAHAELLRGNFTTEGGDAAHRINFVVLR